MKPFKKQAGMSGLFAYRSYTNISNSNQILSIMGFHITMCQITSIEDQKDGERALLFTAPWMEARELPQAHLVAGK